MATALIGAVVILAALVVVQEIRRRAEQRGRETAEAARDAALATLDGARRVHRADVAYLEDAISARDRMLDTAREELRAIRDPAVVRERLLRTLSPRGDDPTGAQLGLPLGGST